MNRRVALWCFVLLWMLLIVWLSGDPGEVSREKSRLVLEIVRPIQVRLTELLGSGEPEIGRLHYYVRKGAHVFLYFVLTGGLVAALAESLPGRRPPLVAAWLAASAFSLFDEYYQTLIPGRSGRLADVLIDQGGVLIALAAAGLLLSRRRRTG